MLESIRNIFQMVKIVHKASSFSIVMALIYKFWVTFVQVVFLTLLPRYLINAYTLKKPYIEVLIVLLVLWITQIGYSIFSNYYNYIFKPVSDERIFQYVQKSIFRKSVSMKLSDFDNPEFYDDFTKASNEAKARAVSSLDLIMDIVMDLSALVVLLYVVIKIHWGFLIIVLVPVLLNISLGKVLDRLTFESDMQVTKADRRVNYVNRTFFLKQFSKEIKTSGIKEVLLDQFQEAVRDIINVRKKYGKSVAALKLATALMNDIACFVAATLFALALLIHSHIIMGDFVFLITSLSTVSQRLQSCIDNCFKLYNSRNYISNLKRFMQDDTKPPEWGNRTKRPVFDWIEMKNVFFKYKENGDTILKDINLKIEAGKKIAIVGYNGAGKTTFIKLLLGLYEVTQGEVKLNGNPICDYDPNMYRTLFSCVFQDYALFGCTVGENVLCREVKEEDRPTVLDALKMSGLYEDMEKKGITMDSMVTKEFDNEGIILSGGQLQKLAIARAFSNNRPIVILDEPSSALDPIAEFKMFERFKDIHKNKTLIYVTHRISSSILADTICFFEDGTIVEKGSHDELMDRNGKYAGLYRMQSEQYRDN